MCVQPLNIQIKNKVLYINGFIHLIKYALNVKLIILLPFLYTVKRFNLIFHKFINNTLINLYYKGVNFY
jgi:hypothetical protein